MALAMTPLRPGAAGQADEKGFTTLFNGKDFTGWIYGRRANGTENRSGKGYQIENGVIYSTTEDGGNLYTEKEYADFVFRFDFKLTENANNGTDPRAAGGRRRLCRHRDPGARRRRDAVHEAAAVSVSRIDLRDDSAKRGSQKPVGEWNTEEITAQGRKSR